MWGREKNCSFNVSDYGDVQPVPGSLDVLDGSSDAEGILTLDNGRGVYFAGKWVGATKIVREDEGGALYTFKVN